MKHNNIIIENIIMKIINKQTKEQKEIPTVVMIKMIATEQLNTF